MLSAARNGQAQTVHRVVAAFAPDLLAYVAANDPDAGIDEIVGDARITRYDPPVGGLRQTTLPYTSTVLQTWTAGIPDQYRTTFRVVVRKDVRNPPPSAAENIQLLDETVYVDEIYGRKLVLDPNLPVANSQFIAEFAVALRLTSPSNAPVTIGSYERDYDRANLRSGSITLTANHPYAASADGSAVATGDYMDATSTKTVTMMLPLTIVNGWGNAGDGLENAWGQREDTAIPEVPNDGGCDTCDQFFFSSEGDARREQIAVGWLVQSSRAADIHARIAKASFDHHHSIGVSTADTWTPGIDVTPVSHPAITRVLG